MDVIEIFKSIDGEGSRTGAPTTFIRFKKCNLRCTYCDTAYVFNMHGKYGDAKAVAQKVTEFSIPGHVNNITITGGEPLLYCNDILDILGELADTGMQYSINIETNGTIIPTRFIEAYNKSTFANMCDSNNEFINTLFFTFDIKTAAAGEYAKSMCVPIHSTTPIFVNEPSIINGSRSVIKAVVGSQSDLDYIKDIYCKGTKWRNEYDWFISPVFGMIEPADIVDYVLAHNELNEWRVQVQLHKIIWDLDKREV